ncbi:HAD hydrolase-like protein [Salinicoccus sp. CNSTN-B1]
MKEAIVFDMDGTLFQTHLILEESLSQALNKIDEYGINYINNPVEKYNEIMGVPLEEVWKILLKKPTDENIKVANQTFQESLVGCIRSGKGKLYDDVEETLESIQNKGYTIFVASNGDVTYLEAIYKYYGLQKYIEKIYSINIVETSSKSDLIRHMIKEEAIVPKYIVGDRLSDFTAGKENNIEVIGCKFNFSKDEELAEANYIVESLKDLNHIIK